MWQKCDSYGAEQSTEGAFQLNIWPAEVKGGQYGRKARIVHESGWKASVWRDEGRTGMRRVWDGEGYRSASEAKRAAETEGLAAALS